MNVYDIDTRRTDMKAWMVTYGSGGYVASQKFYAAAMQVYRDKYKSSQVVFIMVSLFLNTFCNFFVCFDI